MLEVGLIFAVCMYVCMETAIQSKAHCCWGSAPRTGCIITTTVLFPGAFVLLPPLQDTNNVPCSDRHT